MIKITGTFYNDGDEGATFTLKAYTKYGDTIYDRQIFDQYFAPQAYTTVDSQLTFDPSDPRGLYYNMLVVTNTGTTTISYIKCPTCGGTGYIINWTAVSGALESGDENHVE